ncbi:MAG: DUF3987 domain-containing protein [Gammaproteobacteria bacterium]
MDDLRTAIMDSGLRPPHNIIPDGRIHRFSSTGRPGDDAGWYVAYDGDVPAGAYGCWRAGISETWSARRRDALSPAELAEQDRRIREAKKQAEKGRQERQAKAADQARKIWDGAEPAPDHHPYLQTKGIQSHGARVHEDCLLIPMRDSSGALYSLEFIDTSGEKRFLPGGRKKGCYYAIGQPDSVVCIAEGFATAASIYEATGYAVAVAFDAGNLQPVAVALRNKFPDIEIVITGDNDESEIGQKRAREAVEAIGGKLAIPAQANDDWNDVYNQQGAEAVRKGIEVAEVLKVLKGPAPALSEDWPEPQPLPDGLPDVPELDPVLLPEALRPWIKDIAERIQCPLEYPAIGGMISLAATVGRQIGIRPRRHDDWTVVANLWGAIVGRPGLLKTPALTEVMRPLHRLEARAREQHKQEQRDYEAEKAVNKATAKQREKDIAKAVKDGDTEKAHRLALSVAEDEANTPQRRRYVTSDSTVEALGVLLSANPRGILVYRDELTGWLRDMDREGREGSRAFYLEAWNGTGRYTYDRIGRGTIDIEAACVSVLGSIQPGPLSAYLNEAMSGGAGDDGLLQRLQLVAWPDPPKFWRDVDRWPDTEARRTAWGVFERLDQINPEALSAEREDEDSIPYLRLDAAAYELFVEWRHNLERRLREEDEHPAFEAVLAKYRSLIPSIALLIHLADSPEGGEVSETALLTAIAWGEFLEAHARRLYAPTLDPALQAARELDRHIQAGDLSSPFRARDVYLKGWRLLDRTGTENALEYLADLGRVYAVAEQPGAAGGRPSTLWHIHPAIRGQS